MSDSDDLGDFLQQVINYPHPMKGLMIPGVQGTHLFVWLRKPRFDIGQFELDILDSRGARLDSEMRHVVFRPGTNYDGAVIKFEGPNLWIGVGVNEGCSEGGHARAVNGFREFSEKLNSCPSGRLLAGDWSLEYVFFDCEESNMSFDKNGLTLRELADELP